MTDIALKKEADDFRALCERQWPEYPHLIPDGSVMMPWMLDGLCYPLRYRTDWKPHEHAFFRGVCASIARMTRECWTSFTPSPQSVMTELGAVCRAVEKEGWFRKSTNELNVSQTLQSVLQAPQNPLAVLGKSLVFADDHTNFIGLLSYAGCLGMSSWGTGPWSTKFPGELKSHIDNASRWMAESSAGYVRRLWPDIRGITPKLFSESLIWPPAGYHGDTCGLTAAMGIQQYEKKHGRFDNRDLIRLAKLPDDTAALGALVLVLSRLDSLNDAEGLGDVCFVRVTQAASGFRSIAIKLAKDEGREIDWLQTGDARRFEFERRAFLLPFVHLHAEHCMDFRLRPVVELLVAADVKKATEKIAELAIDEPWMEFQQGMLLKVHGKYAEAQAVFERITQRWPDYDDAEFLGEFGMNCVNLKLLDLAIETLNRASESKMRGFALSNLIWAYVCKEDYETALSLGENALALNDVKLHTMLNLRWARLKLGDATGADSELRRAIAMFPFERRCVSTVVGRVLAPEE